MFYQLNVEVIYKSCSWVEDLLQPSQTNQVCVGEFYLIYNMLSLMKS